MQLCHILFLSPDQDVGGEKVGFGNGVERLRVWKVENVRTYRISSIFFFLKGDGCWLFTRKDIRVNSGRWLCLPFFCLFFLNRLNRAADQNHYQSM